MGGKRWKPFYVPWRLRPVVIRGEIVQTIVYCRHGRRHQKKQQATAGEIASWVALTSSACRRPEHDYIDVCRRRQQMRREINRA